MPDNILTVLGRELHDQEHLHLPACLLAQTFARSLLPITGTESLGRQERGSRFPCPVGRFDLPARGEIKHQTPQVVPSNDNAGPQTSCVPPKLSKRSF